MRINGLQWQERIRRLLDKSTHEVENHPKTHQINHKRLFFTCLPGIADQERDITEHHVLIDGHNRYEICQKHDIEFVTVEQHFESNSDAKLWIIKNQFGRRNISDFVRAELALHAEPLIAAKAKERQESGINQHSPTANLPEAETGKTRDELAELFLEPNQLPIYFCGLPYRLA